QAVAHSHGTVGAIAVAGVDIEQNNIVIGGPVTVNAEAPAGVNAVHGAGAAAFLVLHASTGQVTVGENPASGSGSDILVRANAYNLGANDAVAFALADIEANGSGSKAVHTANLLVEAFAFDANAHNATKAI